MMKLFLVLVHYNNKSINFLKTENIEYIYIINNFKSHMKKILFTGVMTGLTFTAMSACNW